MKNWSDWGVRAWAKLVCQLGLCSIAWGVPLAQAQDKIFRCGNSYTNSARIAKEQNCKPLEGGSVTVVHGDGGMRRAAVAPAVSAPVPAVVAKSAAATGSEAPRMQGAEQQRRDNDAKAILQAELDKAQAQLNALKEEYQDGNAVRTALELRNPQIYLNRLEQLKTGIERQEQDLAVITRELSRWP